MNIEAKELMRIAKSLMASKFQIGDLVKFKGRRRVYKVTNVMRGHYDLEATTGGQMGSRPSTVSEDDLMAADSVEAVADKQGRDAATAAKQEFRSGKVVVDFNRVIRESYGEVTAITRSGLIKVQTYVGGDWDGQEDFVPDKSKRGDAIVFSPALHRGEWMWSNSRENRYIKGPYKGGSLSSLLD